MLRTMIVADAKRGAIVVNTTDLCTLNLPHNGEHAYTSWVIDRAKVKRLKKKKDIHTAG